MVASQKGRYSKFIRPISIFLDLLVIITFAFHFFKDLNINFFKFQLYQLAAWCIIAYLVQFYEVYRFTTPVQIISKIAKQSVLFLLVVIAFFPFSKEVIFSGKAIGNFMVSSFIIIIIFKNFFFYYLKKYRLVTGSNFRNVVIVGYTDEAVKLKNLFETRVDYGYKFMGFFSEKKQNPEVKGKLSALKEFIKEHKIDEIYCSLSELTNEQIKDLVDYADESDLNIKFIPDTKDIISKNLKTDYYELFPVLSLHRTALHEPINHFLKRLFDVLFSLFVIFGLLSWLTPILAILIKLESDGPVFFMQSRPGINEQEFFCFKFRSMQLNETTEKEASKNDPRVTRIGKFIRKTSIDEMPQFLNVLIGDMSVVGPRPHLWSQNKFYSRKIKKYMTRHYVKPGITGLAQVKGFRGEIETDEDMINRIKFDVFYIQNWSMFLDLKIILQTIINIFKGEAKAY